MLHALGRCLQLEGDPAAEATLARALACARRVGDTILQGRLLMLLGTCEHLQQAATLFAAAGAQAYYRKAMDALVTAPAGG
ncbi:MAG: hypothetical protein HOY71_12935 [Nonomuraea sp.]|nr:hypothetical protein [Nonomuraea sp.]